MKHKILTGTVTLGLLIGLVVSSCLVGISTAFAASPENSKLMNDQSPETGENQDDETQPGDEQPDPEKPDPEKPEPEHPDPVTPEPENPEPENPQPSEPTPDEPNLPEDDFNDPAGQFTGSGSGANSGNGSTSSSSQGAVAEGAQSSSRPSGQALTQIHVSGNSYTTNDEAIIDAIDETTESNGVELPAMTDEDSVEIPNTGEGGVNFLALGLMMIAGITVVAAGVAVVTLNVLAKRAEDRE